MFGVSPRLASKAILPWFRSGNIESVAVGVVGEVGVRVGGSGAAPVDVRVSVGLGGCLTSVPEAVLVGVLVGTVAVPEGVWVGVLVGLGLGGVGK